MAEESGPPADAADRLFRIVATLAADHPLGPEGAGDLIGVTLEVLPEHTGPSFAVYACEPDADELLREVEFRTPYSDDAPEGQRATTGEFTILRVNPDGGVDADDVLEEYGDPRGPIPEHIMIESDPPFRRRTIHAICTSTNGSGARSASPCATSGSSGRSSRWSKPPPQDPNRVAQNRSGTSARRSTP